MASKFSTQFTVWLVAQDPMTKVVRRRCYTKTADALPGIPAVNTSVRVGTVDDLGELILRVLDTTVHIPEQTVEVFLGIDENGISTKGLQQAQTYVGALESLGFGLALEEEPDAA